MKENFKNIGLLDLRTASETAVERLGPVSNIGLVLVSKETAMLITALKVSNIGGTLEVPEDAKLMSGQTTLNAEFFRSVKGPLSLVITGHVTFAADVTTAILESFDGAFYISGQVAVPQEISGTLQTKTKHLSGQIMTYEVTRSHIVNGKLTIDTHFLKGLADQTSLIINGKVKLLPDVTAELIKKKLANVQVNGKLTCHDDNAEALFSCMKTMPAAVTRIPKDVDVFETSLELDSDTLGALTTRRIHALDMLCILSEVSSEELETHVESIFSAGPVFCPQSVRATVLKLAQGAKGKVHGYDGELWIVKDDLKVNRSRFDYLHPNTTLLVTGELTVEAGVEPSVLAKAIAKLHNMGTIYCSAEQLGALQSRLGIASGEFEVIGKIGESENEEGANVGYLKL